MALPTIPTCWNSRNRVLEQQIVRQREQEARFRQQWEQAHHYFKQSGVYSDKQAQWSSRQSFQQSMGAYHREKQKEEKRKSLEQRRLRLQKILQEERDLLESELKELKESKDTHLETMRERTYELKSAREERRKQAAEELLYEHWKQNNAKLREVESALLQKHVVNAWGNQLTERQQEKAIEDDENRQYENEYEMARREPLIRMKREEERRRQDERDRADVLRQQMEDLKLGELEAKKLKKEQENLLKQQWELEELEEQRRKMEERRRKSELGRFLSRQYKAQLRRRAQQIQEELEMDMRILSALIEKEDEDQRLRSARREQAAADAAWMKSVIEQQLHLEREREAEMDTLFREEAKQVWAKREEEWERERRARDRLMKEVFSGRQLQIQEKMEFNQRAQKESLRLREQLITDLENVKQMTAREKEEHEELKTVRKLQLEEQIAERHLVEQEELLRQKTEEEEARIAEQQYDDLVQQEADLITERGYQKTLYRHPRVAWT